MTLIFGLLLIALLLFFLEIFMPGGVLAVIGGCVLLIAAWLTFESHGIIPAVLLVIGGCFLGVILFFVEIKLLARSPIGRHIRQDSQIAERLNARTGDEIRGKTGVTLTTMAPTGRVQVDGKVYTAVSQDGLLEKGTPVTVLRSETFKLIVTRK